MEEETIRLSFDQPTCVLRLCLLWRSDSWLYGYEHEYEDVTRFLEVSPETSRHLTALTYFDVHHGTFDVDKISACERLNSLTIECVLANINQTYVSLINMEKCPISLETITIDYTGPLINTTDALAPGWSCDDLLLEIRPYAHEDICRRASIYNRLR